MAPATQETVPLLHHYVGTTAAVKSVDLRAKVEGYLEQRPFTEGSDVAQGDVLFVIDQRPFQAELDRSQAEANQNKADLEFAEKEVKRYEPLVPQGAASKEQLDSVQSQAKAAQAALKASEAAIRNAQLALGYTTITAPIDGRIGRTLVNVGNLVTPGETLLANLVQLDPIYVYFSPSETDFLTLESYRKRGKLGLSIDLADGSRYGQSGNIDFVDNTVDPTTGTIKLRAVFANPDKALRPGQYVELQVKLTERSNTVVVPAPAVAQDQAGFHVFVVSKDGKAEQRPVTIGDLYEGKRVIDKGLKAGEQVIVKGLQKVRDGAPVTVTHAATDAGQKATQ